MAEEVVILPVQHTIESLLSPDRAASMHMEDVHEMNDYLEERVNESLTDPVVGLPHVLNDMVDGLDMETLDGLHFSKTVTRAQANILLNARCNDALTKKFPFDKTCCFEYPFPNWTQIVLLLLLTLWGPLGMYLTSQRAFPIHLYTKGGTQTDKLLSWRQLDAVGVLPRAKVPARTDDLRLCMHDDVCDGSNGLVCQGEQIFRAVHVLVDLVRHVCRGRFDDEAGREGSRILESRPDRRMERMDADLDLGLSLVWRVQDRPHLPADAPARRFVPVHDRIRPLQLLCRQRRLQLLASRTDLDTPQSFDGRIGLPDGHGLPLLLFLTACHHV